MAEFTNAIKKGIMTTFMLDIELLSETKVFYCFVTSVVMI